MAVGRLSSGTTANVNQNPYRSVVVAATGGTETTYTSGSTTYKVHTFTASST